MKNPNLAGYGMTVVGVALTTGVIHAIPGADYITNISLLYLLVVIAAAYRFGSGPAVLASLLGVLSFNWFFVEPRSTLRVNDPAEWLALAVFLVTAMVISHLTATLRRHARAEAQARALAEADRLKTALLSMVSHDFRSPLTSIKTSVTGLLQDGVPWDAATQRELLLGIDQETDRLNRMVGNILALSRLESGTWRPQCESVPLAEVVGAALDGFDAEDNKRIAVALDPVLHEVWLDSVQIVQVLHNLLENALKYSPDGSPVELLATQMAMQKGYFLVITVADRGVGLPVGEESQIFEQFYRAPRWRESASPGAGIGLAICRGLIEAHSGQLTASNRSGGGAVFRIILPLHPSESTKSA